MTQPLNPEPWQQGQPDQWGQPQGQPGQPQGQWGPQQSQWGLPQGQWGPPPQGPHGPSQQGGWGPPPPPSKAKKWPWVVGGIVALLVIAGIAGGNADKKNSSETSAASPAASQLPTTKSSPPSTGQRPSSSPAPAVPAPAPAASWTMPNLVGTNLQEAQNRIQSLTNYQIFLTTSHDETGAGRVQVLDANWKVCSQNVRSGATINKDSQIDFGAVKLEESC